MVDEVNSPHTSPFDAIRRVSESHHEYWSARDLSKVLGYDDYRNFLKAIAKAKVACQQSGQAITDHFVDATNMVSIGSKAKRKVSDVHISRYGCYLIVQNADPEKPIVSLGQTYFAVQTRRQELADELALAQLSEDQKRIVLRNELAVLNRRLADAASQAGIIKPEHFAVFTDHGYRGLYGGLTENDIHSLKGLQVQEKILDFMGSDELAANAFRASLTRQKLERDQIQERERANQVHFDMGRRVRNTIVEAGATLPEDLPTPQKSVQQLQHEEQQRLKQRQQLPLFPSGEESE